MPIIGFPQRIPGLLEGIVRDNKYGETMCSKPLNYGRGKEGEEENIYSIPGRGGCNV